MRWIAVLAACLLIAAPVATASSADQDGSGSCSGVGVGTPVFTGTCRSSDCTVTYVAGKPVFPRCDP